MLAPRTILHGPEAPRLHELAIPLATAGEDPPRHPEAPELWSFDTTAASSQGDVPTTRPHIMARPKQGLPRIATPLTFSLTPYTGLYGPGPPD